MKCFFLCKSWGIIIPTASPFDLHSFYLSGDATYTLLDLLPTSHIRASVLNNCNKQLVFMFVSVCVCLYAHADVRACVLQFLLASAVLH